MPSSLFSSFLTRAPPPPLSLVSHEGGSFSVPCESLPAAPRVSGVLRRGSRVAEPRALMRCGRRCSAEARESRPTVRAHDPGSRFRQSPTCGVSGRLGRITRSVLSSAWGVGFFGIPASSSQRESTASRHHSKPYCSSPVSRSPRNDPAFPPPPPSAKAEGGCRFLVDHSPASGHIESHRAHPHGPSSPSIQS